MGAHGDVLVFLGGILLVQFALFVELIVRSRHSRDSVAAILLYCAAVVLSWVPLYYLPGPTTSGWAWFLAVALFPRVACLVFTFLLRRMK